MDKKTISPFFRRVKILFKAILRKLTNKLDDFTRQEPILKDEAIEKTLYLLCKDFNMSDQNDIVITLIQKLNDKREADIIELQKKINIMKEQTQKLKEKVILTQ